MSAPWHADGPALERVLADLIADEVRRLRPGGSPLPQQPWSASMAFDDSGFGLDSLERHTLAAA